MKFFTSLGILLFAHPALGETYDCVIEPTAIVSVIAPDKGQISEVLVARGDRVVQGDILVQLESEVQRLQVELTEVQATSDIEIRASLKRLELRRKEYERVKELEARNVAAQKGLDDAEIELALTILQVEQAEFAQRLTQIQLAQAREFLDRRTVRSPVDGVVLRVDAQPGELAQEQFELLQIAQINPLHVEVFLPLKRYAEISVGNTYRVTQVAPLKGIFDARVVTVDNVFDAASSTFGMLLEIDNSTGDIPAGTRCGIELPNN